MGIAQKIWLVCVGGALFLGAYCNVYAQEQQHIIAPAVVISAGDVVKEHSATLHHDTFTQEVTVRIKQNDTEKVAHFVNDFVPLSVGDHIFVRESIDGDKVFYSIYDLDRRSTLLFIGLIFVAVILLFGGRSGMRSLIALALSVVVILYVLMPVVASGRSPLVWGILIAIVLLAAVMGLTHGLRPKTYAAFLGTSSAVLITGVLAAGITHMASFTGTGTDEAFFLSMESDSIDMARLLLAGIIIGMLGVLDDVAITQAAVVMELKRAGIRDMRTLYKRAMIIGREHVGALINTLVLAYAGASLPLFLLLSTYNEPFGALVSLEIVAVEIVRSIVGSIGLILAVPITTVFAAYFSARDEDDARAVCNHNHSDIE